MYRIKSNSMLSLGVVEFPGEPNRAQFEAKANLVDVTGEANPVSLGGNMDFQMRVSNYGQPNDTDTIGWTLYDSDGTLVFSSNWTGTDTAGRVAKGNLIVHS